MARRVASVGLTSFSRMCLHAAFMCCVVLCCVSFAECVCLCDIAGSLAAGRWTAWPWRDKRTMAFRCRWTPSSSRLLGSWAGGPVSPPSLTTLSGNTEPTSCSLLHLEVNKVDRMWSLCFYWPTLARGRRDELKKNLHPAEHVACMHHRKSSRNLFRTSGAVLLFPLEEQWFECNSVETKYNCNC